MVMELLKVYKRILDFGFILKYFLIYFYLNIIYIFIFVFVLSFLFYWYLLFFVDSFRYIFDKNMKIHLSS